MSENKSSDTSKAVVYAGDNLYGIEPGQRLTLDKETADFLVAEGHATLPPSKQ